MKYVIIDSNAIIHRTFHAIPVLTSPDGAPVNAVYGFCSILLRMMKELKPDAVGAAFDLAGPTFRHVAFERYKAHRPKAPDELYSQFSKVKEVLGAFGVPIYTAEGYEADDVIATLAEKIKKDDPRAAIIIVTGDLDALQLVDDRVSVWTMKKGVSDTVLYDHDAVVGRYGLEPAQLADLRGFRGDASDNIPGVRGIGEKGAIDLLKKFGSVERAYELLEAGKLDATEAVKKKLREGKKDAFMSKELGLARRDVPIPVTVAELRREGDTTPEAVIPLFESLGFFSLVKRVQELNGGKAPQQLSLVPDAEAAVKKIKNAQELAGIVKRGPLAFVQKDARVIIIATADGALHLADATLFKKLSKKDLAVFNACEKIVYDAKSFMHAFAERGIGSGGAYADLMLMSYCTGASAAKSPAALIQQELRRMAPADPEGQAPSFFELKAVLEKKMQDSATEKVFSDIERPLTEVLARMEERGIAVDTAYLSTLREAAKKELATLEARIHERAGRSFNINSTQQLAEILFSELRIAEGTAIKKTGKGNISTDNDQLLRIKEAHPIVPDILEYRELAKLVSTYIDALPKLVGTDGRIHTTFNQAGTATGRLSSQDPNMQNIPIKTERGRQIRRAFVAAPGRSFVAFDYSQLELRVAADMAQDTKMIQAFARDLDIHALTAAEMNNVPLERVTPEMRGRAKTLNFGILYGMGVRSFAESAHIDMKEAKKFFEEYFSDFSGIAAYISGTKEFAKANGYVVTAFGRRRYLPAIVSGGFREQREAERMAINFPIQGTATGDVIKLAMIGVDRWIRDGREGKIALLLQIHDELFFETDDDFVATALREIPPIMERVWKGAVRLKVVGKAGKTWGEMR